MLTETQLNELYPRAPAAHKAAFLERAEGLFVRFGIADDPLRLHYFLAQIGHESGGLTITKEYMNYSAKRLMQVWPSRFPDLATANEYARNPEKLGNNVYANRMGNGPPESGDGYLFRGRGYIQITGRDGYQKVGAEVGAEAGLDLEAKPDEAATPENALLVACAFWEWKNINALCTPSGFTKVTKRINGGTNGMADRRNWLKKVNRILGDEFAGVEEPSAADIVAIQRALLEEGYTEVGAADGLMGPKTRGAIQRFREENGLPAGMIDDALKEALDIDD